jgi:hypothetical protein
MQVVAVGLDGLLRELAVPAGVGTELRHQQHLLLEVTEQLIQAVEAAAGRKTALVNKAVPVSLS